MSKLTVQGAILTCNQGKTPCVLNVVSPQVLGENHNAANILDKTPGVNIPGFSVCTATGLPAPCSPSFPAPWVPGAPNVLLRNAPALRDDSKLQCAIGGTVSITFPGQTTIDLN